MNLFDRTDISLIIKAHYKTFYDYSVWKATGEKKATHNDVIAFLVFPMLTAILISFLQIKITETYLSIIITALAIFVGLLFNFLTLIFNLANQQKQEINKKSGSSSISNSDEAKFILTKELFINISAAIIISIAAICISLIILSKPQLIITCLKGFKFYNSFHQAYFTVLISILIFLIIEFFMTLFMILKRFYLIFKKDMVL